MCGERRLTNELREVMADPDFAYHYGMFVIYRTDMPEIQIIPPTYEEQS